MASKMKYANLFMVACLFGFVLSVLSQDTGIAVINDPPYVPSACFGDQDQGVMVAGVDHTLWFGGKICGIKFQVTCIGATNEGTPQPCLGSNTVTVMVTDYCGHNCQGTFLLSKESFSAIADPSSGAIQISYQLVY